ncbi:TetR/AcrR family transcriptional regulator [Gordonia sp. TBRC 11910]|uniref:TetR/AcrR family transcriptional regulator n=1 Tax=Gordonia asplenii TaxID=2725283 RepID=A0A848L8I4_9ACTN|nr:TetR/AcrR family transcriptional regulator [Gordonia asplenii]NMO05275.1 TetR/AcrR family transcriptional regulator [Gordonia asplenii]
MRLLVTREMYYDAAMRLLATEGVSSLKIARLCRELNVSSGSFYGYFGSLDGFVADFLDYWEETQTANVVEMSLAPVDPKKRVRALKELGGGLPHDAEAAIRGWAHTNERVAAAQKRVDARRQQAMADVIGPIVGNRAQARKLAAMGMALLIGLQQWKSPVTKRDYNLLFNEYERVIMDHVDRD